MVQLCDKSALALAAESYLAAGLCVLPARLDKKYPLLDTWKQFQSHLPAAKQVDAWFGGTYGDAAMCVIAGSVSGGLEVIDFDSQAEAFDAWCELIEAETPGLLSRLVIERSQGLGKHVAYRYEGTVPGSEKLAEKLYIAPDANPVVYKGKTYKPRKIGNRFEYYPGLAETRGEDGLFLCAPSPGYVLEQGSFEDVPVITAEEREVLIRCASSFNERPEMALMPSLPVVGGGDRPGDHFNERGDIRDLLTKHGWTLAKPGDNQYWRRPGKEDSWSATYNGQVFYCFTSSAPPFDLNRGYSKFQVYALLEHNGDYSAAARALSSQGYSGAISATVPGIQAHEPLTPSYKSVRQLLANYPQLRPPVIHGLLRRGETMNVIAPPKAGKSWLVTDLALSVATGRPWLGQFPTEHGQVLIMDNELHGETSRARARTPLVPPEGA